jgi:hypothetical protein
MGPDGGMWINPFYSPVYGLPKRFRSDPLKRRTACGNGYMDIGLNLHLLMFGVEFRIKVSEIIDFLVGFTTLDMNGDDIRAYPDKTITEEERKERLEQLLKEQREFELENKK